MSTTDNKKKLPEKILVLPPKEPVVTRCKSAQMSRQLRSKDKSLRLLKFTKAAAASNLLRRGSNIKKKQRKSSNPRKSVEEKPSISLKRPNVYKKELTVTKDMENEKMRAWAKKTCREMENSKQNLPESIQKKLSALSQRVKKDKVTLKAPDNYKSIMNKRKPIPIKLGEEKASNQDKIESIPTQEEPLKTVFKLDPDLELESLTDSDLNEIILCPSPVWWEDDEDVLFINKLKTAIQGDEEMRFHLESVLTPKNNEAGGLSRITKIKRKGASLENILVKIKNKAEDLQFNEPTTSRTSQILVEQEENKETATESLASVEVSKIDINKKHEENITDFEKNCEKSRDFNESLSNSEEHCGQIVNNSDKFDAKVDTDDENISDCDKGEDASENPETVMCEEDGAVNSDSEGEEEMLEDSDASLNDIDVQEDISEKADIAGIGTSSEEMDIDTPVEASVALLQDDFSSELETGEEFVGFPSESSVNNDDSLTDNCFESQSSVTIAEIDVTHTRIHKSPDEFEFSSESKDESIKVFNIINVNNEENQDEDISQSSSEENTTLPTENFRIVAFPMPPDISTLKLHESCCTIDFVNIDNTDDSLQQNICHDRRDFLDNYALNNDSEHVENYSDEEDIRLVWSDDEEKDSKDGSAMPMNEIISEIDKILYKCKDTASKTECCLLEPTNSFDPGNDSIGENDNSFLEISSREINTFSRSVSEKTTEENSSEVLHEFHKNFDDTGIEMSDERSILSSEMTVKKSVTDNTVSGYSSEVSNISLADESVENSIIALESDIAVSNIENTPYTVDLKIQSVYDASSVPKTIISEVSKESSTEKYVYESYLTDLETFSAFEINKFKEMNAIEDAECNAAENKLDYTACENTIFDKTLTASENTIFEKTLTDSENTIFDKTLTDSENTIFDKILTDSENTIFEKTLTDQENKLTNVVFSDQFITTLESKKTQIVECIKVSKNKANAKIRNTNSVKTNKKFKYPAYLQFNKNNNSQKRENIVYPNAEISKAANPIVKTCNHKCKKGHNVRRGQAWYRLQTLIEKIKLGRKRRDKRRFMFKSTRKKVESAKSKPKKKPAKLNEDQNQYDMTLKTDEKLNVQPKPLKSKTDNHEIIGPDFKKIVVVNDDENDALDEKLDVETIIDLTLEDADAVDPSKISDMSVGVSQPAQEQIPPKITIKTVDTKALMETNVDQTLAKKCSPNKETLQKSPEFKEVQKGDCKKNVYLIVESPKLCTDIVKSAFEIALSPTNTVKSLNKETNNVVEVIGKDSNVEEGLRKISANDMKNKEYEKSCYSTLEKSPQKENLNQIEIENPNIAIEEPTIHIDFSQKSLLKKEPQLNINIRGTDNKLLDKKQFIKVGKNLVIANHLLKKSATTETPQFLNIVKNVMRKPIHPTKLVPLKELVIKSIQESRKIASPLNKSVTILSNRLIKLSNASLNQNNFSKNLSETLLNNSTQKSTCTNSDKKIIIKKAEIKPPLDKIIALEINKVRTSQLTNDNNKTTQYSNISNNINELSMENKNTNLNNNSYADKRIIISRKAKTNEQYYGKNVDEKINKGNRNEEMAKYIGEICLKNKIDEASSIKQGTINLPCNKMKDNPTKEKLEQVKLNIKRIVDDAAKNSKINPGEFKDNKDSQKQKVIKVTHLNKLNAMESETYAFNRGTDSEIIKFLLTKRNINSNVATEAENMKTNDSMGNHLVEQKTTKKYINSIVVTKAENIKTNDLMDNNLVEQKTTKKNRNSNVAIKAENIKTNDSMGNHLVELKTTKRNINCNVVNKAENIKTNDSMGNHLIEQKTSDTKNDGSKLIKVKMAKGMSTLEQNLASEYFKSLELRPVNKVLGNVQNRSLACPNKSKNISPIKKGKQASPKVIKTSLKGLGLLPKTKPLKVKYIQITPKNVKKKPLEKTDSIPSNSRQESVIAPSVNGFIELPQRIVATNRVVPTTGSRIVKSLLKPYINVSKKTADDKSNKSKKFDHKSSENNQSHSVADSKQHKNDKDTNFSRKKPNFSDKKLQDLKKNKNVPSKDAVKILELIDGIVKRLNDSSTESLDALTKKQKDLIATKLNADTDKKQIIEIPKVYTNNRKSKKSNSVDKKDIDISKNISDADAYVSEVNKNNTDKQLDISDVNKIHSDIDLDPPDWNKNNSDIDLAPPDFNKHHTDIDSDMSDENINDTDNDSDIFDEKINVTDKDLDISDANINDTDSIISDVNYIEERNNSFARKFFQHRKTQNEIITKASVNFDKKTKRKSLPTNPLDVEAIKNYTKIDLMCEKNANSNETSTAALNNDSQTVSPVKINLQKIEILPTVRVNIERLDKKALTPKKRKSNESDTKIEAIKTAKRYLGTSYKGEPFVQINALPPMKYLTKDMINEIIGI